MPYAATAGQTATSPKVVTRGYDGASRVVQMTDAGGGSTAYDYVTNSGLNDVLVSLGPAPSGENAKQRQFENDGAGRLTSVCEVSSSVNGHGTCAQSHSQSGLWTKYTYDVLGDLLTVAQNAQSGTRRIELIPMTVWGG